MTCPHPDTLLLDELGELPVVRREALRTHVETCARCASERAGLRQTIVELGAAVATPGARRDGAVFSAGVLATAKVTPQTRRPPARRWGNPCCGRYRNLGSRGRDGRLGHRQTACGGSVADCRRAGPSGHGYADGARRRHHQGATLGRDSAGSRRTIAAGGGRMDTGNPTL